MKKSVLILSMIGLSVIGLSASRIVSAQNTDSAEIRITPVKLNAEGATLYSVLKTLFGQVKADFTIVDSLKTIPVTVRINQPFRIALSSVLKAAGQQITYEFADGIYHIAEANDDEAVRVDISPVEETLLPPKPKPQMRVLKVRNGSGLEVAALLGAKFIPWISSFYPPYVGSNPFAPVLTGSAGFSGFGNNGGGGAAMGLSSGYNGMYALPGLGLGFLGNGPNTENDGSSGNGGR